MKRLFFPVLCLCFVLTACSNPVAPLTEGLDAPVSAAGNYNAFEGEPYSNEGTSATLIGEYSDDEGICEIKIYENYFDVTLDETCASAYDAGYAYGKAIVSIYPELSGRLEPYIFENIRMAFADLGDDYTPVEDRMHGLFNSLDEHYQQEVLGLCDAVCGDYHGIYPDGILSVEEMMLIQMVPDCLRPTACSGLSLWGSKTETGDMITIRCLEWLLGSDNSMTSIHTLLHIRNGERTITNIGFLGLFDTISGINDDGVFMAMLDADSDHFMDCENRTCYSFAIRHALEQFDNAHDAAQYMVDNAPSFTFCHNVMVTDGNEAYCAEDAVAQLIEDGTGHPCLRDSSTHLMDGISWDSPDSLCIVNAFLSEGNYDLMSGNAVNAVRFSKYNEWVEDGGIFDLASVKNMMTQEVVDTVLYNTSIVENVHRDNLTQMIIVDYHTGNVQIAFTGPEGVTDHPVFTAVGNYNDWV
ncbi:MAG: hypothetical protein IJ757_06405 [Clostridiales bacterium]|nr:hypothetical protein [Clostridiales bacterium]